MIPLQCPNCKSEIDMVPTPEKKQLVLHNELGEKEKLDILRIIKIFCGACGHHFWTLEETWDEFVETFL